jgi:hypothetical protein
MRISAWWLAAVLVVPLGAGAQVSVNVQLPGLVSMAPPAPRYEPEPAPRGGYVWVPGRWAWGGSAYAWQAGQWQPARPDHAYAPGRWVQADGGWRWVEGGWKPHKVAKRDRDWDDDGGGSAHGHGGGHCPPGQAKKGNC